MRALINFATGRYIKGQERLKQSIEGMGVDFFGFTDETQIGSPKHKDNPYAFKCYAIDEVLKKGYTSILWVDASVWAVKDINPLFDIIEDEGYLMEEAGHYVGRWCNLNAKSYFGVTDEEIKTKIGEAINLGNTTKLDGGLTEKIATGIASIPIRKLRRIIQKTAESKSHPHTPVELEKILKSAEKLGRVA